MPNRTGVEGDGFKPGKEAQTILKIALLVLLLLSLPKLFDEGKKQQANMYAHKAGYTDLSEDAVLEMISGIAILTPKGDSAALVTRDLESNAIAREKLKTFTWSNGGYYFVKIADYKVGVSTTNGWVLAKCSIFIDEATNLPNIMITWESEGEAVCVPVMHESIKSVIDAALINKPFDSEQ